MRHLIWVILFASSFTLYRCSQAARAAKSDTGETFLLGTYDDEGVHEPGIYRFRLSPAGQLTNLGRIIEANNPSFIATTDPAGTFVAVEELDPGNVISFVERKGSPGSYELRSRQPSGGAHACHVAQSYTGLIVASNYSSGTVELLRADYGGHLQVPFDTVHHDRLGAETPHAHSTYFLKDDAEVIAADLGTDQLWRYRIRNERLEPHPAQPTITLAKGAGPRHLARHPNDRWLYAINELNSTITQVTDVDKDVFTIGNSWSTLPAGYEGENACADIHISMDGRFLYGSNRGHNSIVVYSIDQETGALTLVEHESVVGDWPRNFALSNDDRFIIVANQRSKSLTVLGRNEKTGALDLVSKTTAPVPVCVRFEEGR